MSSEGPGGLSRALVLAVVMAGTTMTLLDIAVVNVALPSIMVALGANVLEARWVVTAFMLAQAVVMPLTGWLSRRIGLGPLFLSSLFFFTLGTGLCAASWSIESLVMARIIEAIGAGAMQPTAMAIITDTFPVHQRGRAIGIWGISLTIGPALGPSTAGYLIEVFDWRSAFMLNLPIGLASILFSLAVLRRDRPEKPPGFDWSGFLAFGVFLVTSMLTLAYGVDEGWRSSLIALGIGLSGFAFLVFVALEWNYREALIPLRLFLIPDFSIAMFISLVRSLGMFGSFFLQPIFLQQIQGYDPIDTGIMMVPASLSFAVGMPLAGMLTDRFGGKWPTVIGALISAYSFSLYWDLDFLSDRWAVIYPQFFRGIGMAMVMSPSTTVGLNCVPRENVGTAAWMMNLGQTFGGSVVIALLATFLNRVSMAELDRLGTSGGFNGGSPVLLSQWALRLGHAPAEANSVAQALVGYSASQAASTLAFHYNWMVVSFGLLVIVIPALFISHRRIRAPGV